MRHQLASEVTGIRALLRLDLFDQRSIVNWAAEKLAGGEDAIALVELAGLADPAREDVVRALDALADGLGLEPLTENAAGMAAAEWEAGELIRGSTTPIEGARKLWRIARLAPSVEPRLRVFVGLASEWDDDPENRGSYEEEIRSQAMLLSGWSE